MHQLALISRRACKYGLGLCLSTQALTDLTRTEAGYTILTNS
ncbi:hypothetical protein [Thermosporothrix hazakensis]|nr:hypothetical protein [Thermosporothrix hazakensis]